MLSSLPLSHTHTHTHTHPTSSSGRRGILFNGIMLFLLLSAFPQTPCLPCRENNESTKPFVRTSTQHFHLRRPPIPKKQPTLHSHLPNVISMLSHFHFPPARLPILLLAGWVFLVFSFFFFFFFSAGKMCSRFAYRKMWRRADRARESEERRFGAEAGGGGHGGAICPSLSAAVNMVTSAGWRAGDGCADCMHRLQCVS